MNGLSSLSSFLKTGGEADAWLDQVRSTVLAWRWVGFATRDIYATLRGQPEILKCIGGSHEGTNNVAFDESRMNRSML